MFKKFLLCVLLLFLIGVGLDYFTSPKKLAASCAFCTQTIVDAQKFYEDDLVLALYTHKPLFPGHCLIIPKRHVERFEMLSDAEAAQMMHVIKRINTAVTQVFGTSAYLLLQKNGYEVGQTVPHVHFHYIPRLEGDSSQLKFFIRMIWINANKPISSSEMQETVARLKMQMASAVT